MSEVGAGREDWWAQRRTAVLLVLLSVVPLLWPDLPPLVDLPGHIGRYKVLLDLDASPALQHFYSFRWAWMGNLGVDLLIVPLAPLIGLEPAVKLVILAIPPMTVAGFLWTAHEAHGRIPPTALFAVPLAYNFPFLFGFVNFCLAMALAFLAFALWLRLGRQGRWRLRAAIFVPLTQIIWVAHAMGWVVLAGMAGAYTLTAERSAGQSWPRALWRTAILCLPLAAPAVLQFVWRNWAGGVTEDWLNIPVKATYLMSPLRDRWWWLDLPSFTLIVLLLGWGLRRRGLGYLPTLGMAALALFALFMVTPRRVFGSSYADMRLAPYVIAAALIALRIRADDDRRWLARSLAGLALAFILVRTAAGTVSQYLYGRAWDRELVALDHVPRGARLVSLVGTRCRDSWEMTRLEHLPGLAIARREAFSNDQWQMPGAPLLRTDYAAAGDFASDPSQVIELTPCRGNHWRSAEAALRGFPRQAFDYVWLVNAPPLAPGALDGLQPVWRSGRSAVLRVVRAPPPASAREFSSPRNRGED